MKNRVFLHATLIAFLLTLLTSGVFAANPNPPANSTISGVSSGLAVSSVSASATFPGSVAQYPVVQFINETACEVFVLTGTLPLTATAGAMPIQPGRFLSTYIGSSTAFAAVTSGCSGTLRVAQWTGQPSYGGSSDPTTAPAPTLTYSISSSITVGTTSGTVLNAGVASKIIQLCTAPTSTANVWLNAAGGTAVAGTGIPVYAGGGCTTFGTASLPLPTGALNGITDGGVSQILATSGG